jgi:hypothetical protein
MLAFRSGRRKAITGSKEADAEEGGRKKTL